ncbi:MAG: hypothetical protein ACLTYN_03770 [Dysosmobacter welbionis]
MPPDADIGYMRRYDHDEDQKITAVSLIAVGLIVLVPYSLCEAGLAEVMTPAARWWADPGRAMNLVPLCWSRCWASCPAR